MHSFAHGDGSAPSNGRVCPAEAFVLGHTTLTRLTFIPTISLYLADKVIPVWEESERDAPPFWAFAWAGGQALARYVLDNPDLVRGKTVLDLASGSGLVAIAAAQAGAKHVTATEIDPLAKEAIALNAKANHVEVEVGTNDAEVILAGDIFYSRDMTEQMLSFLDESRADLILVGDPGRAYAPAEGFDQIAQYDVPVNRDLEDTDLKRTVILRRITRLRSKDDIAFNP